MCIQEGVAYMELKKGMFDYISCRFSVREFQLLMTANHVTIAVLV
jgi:hypothetical protein